MTRFATAVIALLWAPISVVHAQTKSDEEQVHNLPQVFCSAFNKHDGHEYVQLMADDVDYVTPGATLLHGKPDVEKYHTRLLNGRFHSIKWEPLQVAVCFLRPDIAIVQWSWTAAGDKNPDGTARKRRYGIMTMIAEKRAGSWLLVASQNDNSSPGLTPELEGITLPMPVPNQVGVQPSNP